MMLPAKYRMTAHSGKLQSRSLWKFVEVYGPLPPVMAQTASVDFTALTELRAQASGFHKHTVT
jgi:hypothetical protein